MRDLEGRVAVVTGAASGIGRALAERFAAAGMRLVLADVEEDALRETAAALEAAGAELVAAPTDVAVPEAVEALADRARERFGGFDVVCNNAGVGTGGAPLWEVPLAEWEWVLGVNLWGVVHGIRAFVPDLVARGEGHVVNTASLAGLLCPPGMGVYNATKHAVVAISETLHGDLRSAGSKVGVSVLCPGFVRTRIFESERNRPQGVPTQPRSADEDALREKLTAQLLAGAMAPEAVAGRVFDAVREGRFWVLTHPEAHPAVEARMRRVLAEENPDPRGPLAGAAGAARSGGDGAR